jgi:hypothetical protein
MNCGNRLRETFSVFFRGELLVTKGIEEATEIDLLRGKLFHGSGQAQLHDAAWDWHKGHTSDDAELIIDHAFGIKRQS